MFGHESTWHGISVWRRIGYYCRFVVCAFFALLPGPSGGAGFGTSPMDPRRLRDRDADRPEST
jgi:hypothetical protein